MFGRGTADGASRMDMSFADRFSMGFDGGLWKLVVIVVIIGVVAYLVWNNKKKKAAELESDEDIQVELDEEQSEV